jgi:hypothetical protein
VLALTHHLLPGMLERGWGRIVNVASMAALLTGTPTDVLYGATKSFVQRFSEGITAEYADAGIRCTASLPGPTDTGLFVASSTAGHAQSSELMRRAMMSPEIVARQAYEAVMAGRPSIVHGRHNRALAVILLHAPLGVRRALSNSLASWLDRD